MDAKVIVITGASACIGAELARQLGADEANKILSQKRADAVLAYLQAKGIDPARMKAEGLGEEPNYFVADNKTPEGRQQNRRVEIISVGME